MNLKTLQQFCQKWQQILKLMDWDVSVKVVSSEEIDDAEGLVTWDLGKKVADIKIAKPEEYSTDAMRPHNIEHTLVHELLHLHFAPFNVKAGLKATSQEQAINAIAEALVNLKKQR